MDSDIYLNQKEADDFTMFLLETGAETPCTEFGVKWVAQRGQYQVFDRYKWFLAKIKHGF